MPESPPRRAVCTAVIGSYEILQEQPVAKASSMPFICLTDDPGVTSDTWDVRVVQPAFERDAVRSSRSLKILGTPLLAEYDETLWIDNRVILEADPDIVLAELLADADLAVMYHSFRDSLLAEFDEVVRRGLDEPARVYEQLIHYAETRPDVLDERPCWTGILARRWTPEVGAAMRTWMDHVLRYSRRDQLSFPFAVSGLARMRALELDNVSSDWHTWITDEVSVGRVEAMRVNAFHTSIRAPLAVVAEYRADAVSARAQLEAERKSASAHADLLRLELDAATARSDQAVAEVGELHNRVARLRARLARKQRKLERERRRSARLQAELESTQSWRARRLGRSLRRSITRAD